MPVLPDDSLNLMEFRPGGAPGALTSETMQTAWDYSLRTSSQMGLSFARREAVEKYLSEYEDRTGRKMPRQLTQGEIIAEQVKAAEEGRPPRLTLEDRFLAEAGPEYKTKIDETYKAAMTETAKNFFEVQERSTWFQRNVPGLIAEIGGASVLDPVQWAALLIQPEAALIKSSGARAVGEAAALIGGREMILGGAQGGLQAALVEDELKALGLPAATPLEGAAFGSLAGLTLGALAGAGGQAGRHFLARLSERERARVEPEIRATVDDLVDTVARATGTTTDEARVAVRANIDEAVVAVREGRPARVDAPEVQPRRMTEDNRVILSDAVASQVQAETPTRRTATEYMVDVAEGKETVPGTPRAIDPPPDLVAFQKAVDADLPRAEIKKLWDALPEDTKAGISARMAVAEAERAARAEMPTATPPDVRAVARDMFDEAIGPRRADELGEKLSRAKSDATREKLVRQTAEAAGQDPDAAVRSFQEKMAPREAAPSGRENQPRGLLDTDAAASRTEPTPTENRAQADIVKTEVDRLVAEGLGDLQVDYGGRRIALEDLGDEISGTDDIVAMLKHCVTGGGR